MVDLGTTACKWDNVIPFEPMWAHIWRVLKPNGAVVLFGSEPFSSHLRMSQIKHYKYDWVWYKNTPSGIACANKRPMKKHENISVFYKSLPTYNKQMRDCSNSVKERWKDGQKKKQGKSELEKISDDWVSTYRYKVNPYSVLEFNSVPNASGRFHPTQKPVTLLEYLIKTYTLEGETVLDFTSGSCSTGVACVNTGRKFIGIETDENYFNIGAKRIAEAQEKLVRAQETLF